MNKITGGKPGPGRPKGSQNKVTKAAKEAIAEAAEKLGGVNRIVQWAKEDAKNEHAFWATIYPKLLPLQLAGEVDVNARITRLETVVVPAPIPNR